MSRTRKDFLKQTILDVKKECELNFVFFDVMNYIDSGYFEFCDNLNNITSATTSFTKFIVSTVNCPSLTSDAYENISFHKMYSNSTELAQRSDLMFGIKREKKTFLKKVLNFLLFWKKSNNFTINVLKNRNGDKKSYKMNLNLETSETEIL